MVSGQVGISAKGKVASGIARQSEQAFRNVLACLKANGMTKKDLVKITALITDPRFVADYRDARSKVLGDDVLPASTLMVVAGLASPELLVEIEAEAVAE